MLLNIKRRRRRSLFIIDPSPREKMTLVEGDHPSQRAVEAAVAGSLSSMAKPPTHPHHEDTLAPLTRRGSTIVVVVLPTTRRTMMMQMGSSMAVIIEIIS